MKREAWCKEGRSRALFSRCVRTMDNNPWSELTLKEAGSFSAEPPENVGKTEVPERKFDMIQSEIRGFDKSGKQLKFVQRKKEKGILSCCSSFDVFQCWTGKNIQDEKH